MFLLALLFACAASSPFQGPGLTESGAVRADLAGPFVIALTRAVPNKDHVDDFDARVEAIEAQLLESKGLVGYSLRGEIGGRDRWTMTIWESEEAMVGFITSDAHLEAMGRSRLLLDEVESVVWEESDREAVPPRWKQALERLE